MAAQLLRQLKIQHHGAILAEPGAAHLDNKSEALPCRLFLLTEATLARRCGCGYAPRFRAEPWRAAV